MTIPYLINSNFTYLFLLHRQGTLSTNLEAVHEPAVLLVEEAYLRKEVEDPNGLDILAIRNC